MQYEVWCDGSCDPNPGVGGWGVVILHEGRILEEAFGKSAGETTNNRMEYEGAIQGMNRVPAGSEVVVYSDSQLLVNTMETWLANWLKNGKLAQKKNTDLIMDLYRHTKRMKSVKFQWVRGHAGHEYNELADMLAMKGMRE